MSPHGDPELALLRTDSLPLDRDSSGPITLEGNEGFDVLPLRLSVARGGLGIELSRSVKVGPLTCEHLDAALLGISYPVDLSKGVKQFRSRRSELKGATFTVDLRQLASRWSQCLEELWGETVRVRLSVGASDSAAEVRSPEEVANRNEVLDTLAVCMFSTRGVLAFDLVVASGAEPRLIVDQPRSLGELPFLAQRPALRAALSVIDAGLSAATAVDVTRRGRAVDVGGLAQAICLDLMPRLGFRMPHVDRQVIVALSSSLGHVRCELGHAEQPFAAGHRALQLTSSADFLRMADDLLAHGEMDRAREEYIRSLDTSPHHQEVLLDLADLDLSSGGRAESALSLIEDVAISRSATRSHRQRRAMLLGRALNQTSRPDGAREALEEAFELEHDPVFSAYLACTLAAMTPQTEAALALLDRAVSRAPLVEAVRAARLKYALKEGDVATARVDAEQLEAMVTESEPRARQLLSLGALFRDHGHEGEAVRFFRRCLRLVPTDPHAMVSLGALLHQAGESLRAAELLSSALRLLEEDVQPDMPVDEYRMRAELRHQSHFVLAQVLASKSDHAPEILLHLGAIPMRSPWAAEARMWEIEIYQSGGHRRERDHVVGRLIEGLQLGWIEPRSIASRLEGLLARLTPPLDSELTAVARALIAAHVDSSSAQ